MAIDTKPRVIDGATYTVTQLPARRAARLAYRLAGLLGSAIAPLGGQVAGGKMDLGNIDIAGAGAAIDALMRNCTPDEFDKISAELLYAATLDGKALTPALLDSEFAGRMSTYFKILGFAFEVNFSDFFAAMRGAIATAVSSAMAEAAQKLSSSAASSILPTSGASGS